MMASASSGHPYEGYNNTEIEQDLIDPDDGISDLLDRCSAPLTDILVSSKCQ